ncbi:MAG: hypothetical protein ACFCUE_07685 [Candidatus Bathyarchaeia archaeon]
MKNKCIAILVIILLASTTIYLTSSTPTQAAVGQGDWITKYRIETADTHQLLLEEDFTTGTKSGSGAIAQGADLMVTVTINIGISQPSANLNLATELQKSSGKDYYWSHDTSDGYNLGSYNPNSQSFNFPQNAGTLTIVCYGRVPDGKVVQTVGNVTLHKPTPIGLVVLKDPSGAVLDQVKPYITDGKIDEYNTLLKAKQEKLASLQASGASPSFVQAFQNTIEASQKVAQDGFADNAIAMLNAFNVADPANATLEILFIPLIAVFAVLSGVFGFMFMRSKGKVGYYKLVVEDQIKDLEGISLRAAKIDRTMGASLESVKDRLKRLVGM